jgi:hypothetical protein
MKKILLLAVLASFVFAAPASAASGLSMGQAKRKAKSVTRSMANSLAETYDEVYYSVEGCYRLNRMSVRCTQTFELDDVTCDSDIKVTKTRYGLLVRFPGEAECY